jgi:CubicO group peptidase (beta-lactamase class C family)
VLRSVLLTTALLRRLVERGEVHVDERVTRYLPEFALRDGDAAPELRSP